jgi:hypothetical protein
MSDKVDFKLTLHKWDQERHSILIKGEAHWKEVTIINLYAPMSVHPISSNIYFKGLKNTYRLQHSGSGGL